MTLHIAEKVVIVTEKIIAKGVCKIIDDCGATGYTIIPAGGKGSRNIRSTTERASVVDDFANIQIEIIVNNTQMAEAIMDKVRDKYFKNYSGITYLEDIKILRPEKF
ncbi:P-II family nitrogen regulator [Ningiella sp. W23]|uniref:P-II family nitrogen regulator n=1 Tax=Ningiella sp. W23 TaxID=3023715 RepID=UPI003756AF45